MDSIVGINRTPGEMRRARLIMRFRRASDEIRKDARQERLCANEKPRNGSHPFVSLDVIGRSKRW